jgi:hypothetical protein
MIRLRLFFLFTFLLSIHISQAQTGFIQGRVWLDGEVLSGCEVKLTKDNVDRYFVIADSTGFYSFNNVSVGTYTLQVNHVKIHTHKERVTIRKDQTELLDIDATALIESLVVVTKVARRVSSEGEEDVDPEKGMAGNDPASVLSTVPNVTVRRDGGFQVGPNRTSATGLFVNSDNTQSIGPRRISLLGIGNIRVVDQGVAARYGGFTGGGVVFEQAPIGLEKSTLFRAQTSSVFDQYHHNRVSFYTVMPMKMDSIVTNNVVKKWTKFGSTFLISYEYKRDPNPNFQGIYVLTPEAQERLQNNPISVQEQNGNWQHSANQITREDLTQQSYRNNAARHEAMAEWRLSYQPVPGLTFDATNTYQFVHRQLGGVNNSLMNWEQNPTQQFHYINSIFKVNHVVKKPYALDGKPDTTSDILRSLSYFLEANFQQNFSETTHPDFGRDFMRYGHHGYFNTTRIPVYQRDSRVLTNGLTIRDAWILTGYRDTFIGYQPGNQGTEVSRYNQLLYEALSPASLNDFQSQGALLNGFSLPAVHSLYAAPGMPSSAYSKSSLTRTSITARIHANLTPTKDKSINHQIEIGLNVQKDNRASYSLNAAGLWQLMPLLANRHATQLDLSSPQLAQDQNGRFLDSVFYPILNEKELQTHFDKNLRASLNQNGQKLSQTDHINVLALNPEDVSLDMFSAEELLNNGNPFASFSGYDHLGNRARRNQGVHAFLGPDKHIDGYTPISTALWIQDKFIFKSLIVRLGLRYERFDANQYVLKDAFSLYPIKQAGEVQSLSGQSVAHPKSIKEDYAVYVNNSANPTSIVGYRKGAQWFDANGLAVTDPNFLAQQTEDGRIQPYLIDQEKNVESSAFKSYEVISNLLPRVSFSFPLKRNMLLYASYDQLAQHPLDNQVYVPYNLYEQWHLGATNFLPNGDLKPRIKTDYTLGLKQLFGDYSSLEISANYAQIKNDFNLIRMEQAYPYSYTTYGNVDFSTIKRYQVTYGYESKTLFFNATYLMQFADGTGSNSNSAAALIQSGQPNLRSLYPLAFDHRHTLKGNMAYQFRPKTGPRIGETYLLNNTRFTCNIQAISGGPYTAIVQAVSEAQSANGLVQRSQVKGNPFGHRLPWKVYTDLRVDKTFRAQRKHPLQMYVQVSNLFNARIVENVYAYTGSPTDDGYLNSPQGQQQIRNQVAAQSFVDLYKLRLNNANNLGAPRQIVLGVQWNM